MQSLYVGIKSFVFILNTVSYWRVFSRDLQVAGDGQAPLNYAKRTLNCSGEKGPGRTRSLVLFPWHHTCQKWSSKPILLLLLSTWLISIFQIPLQWGVTMGPSSSQRNVSTSEMCCLKGMAQDQTIPLPRSLPSLSAGRMAARRVTTQRW